MTAVQKTQCAIAGGGPAGMMLGLLLARAGVDVIVLEKHADFFRDFRGDTVHPSTLDLMYQLGLLDDFLRLPHQEMPSLKIQLEGRTVPGPDFSALPTHCKFVALMPQWDFLNFLAEKSKRYPSFRLSMQSEARDLIVKNGRVTGVGVIAPDGRSEIEADLVVAADGRHSTIRAAAGFAPLDLGAPMDVLWMRITRRESDGEQVFGYFGFGKALIMLNRATYWQCAYVIPKGRFEAIKARGLQALRDDIVSVVPYLADRAGDLRSWDDVKLLTVTVNRLERWWRPGLLCIGDAAHAMSPIGGVGINLAIGDAVAAANLLWKPLRERCVSDTDVQAVQRRREDPVRRMQSFQIAAQNRLVFPLLNGKPTPAIPVMRFLLGNFPALRRSVARVVGLGYQPERVESPAST
jgi:2-polyprenyl-6-methoxyphenol hydroxylase-like FAD-dependent oxidoreductase